MPGDLDPRGEQAYSLFAFLFRPPAGIQAGKRPPRSRTAAPSIKMLIFTGKFLTMPVYRQLLLLFVPDIRCGLKCFFMALLFFAVNEVHAQDGWRITVEGDKISIRQAFDRIEAQSPYTVAYNRTRFDVSREVSLFVRNAAIGEVLSLLLKDSGWTFRMRGSHIIIVKEKDRPADQKIRGRVRDKSTGLPLPSASVTVPDDPAKGALSDGDGYFEISGLPAGKHEVRASLLGYEPLVYRDIPEREAFVEIYLTERPFRLDEIVVESPESREQALLSPAPPPAGSRMFGRREASRYAGGFDDPARLVTSFAGAAGGTGDNSVIIHGNAPHLLQWRLEGMEIANPNHFADLTTLGGGLFSALSSHVLGHSAFLTGAYPAEYSNAFSGIVDMRLRNGNSRLRESSVQVSPTGIDLASEGPLRKGRQASYLFNYRSASFAPVRRLIPDMKINGFSYRDLSFKLHFPWRDKGSLSLWGLALMDRNDEKFREYPGEWNGGSNLIEDRMDISGNQAMASGGMTGHYYPNDRLSLKTSLGVVYTNNNLVPDTVLSLDLPILNLRNRSYHVNATACLNYTVRPGLTLESGISRTSLFYHFFYSRPEQGKTVQNRIEGHTATWSAYLTSRFRTGRITFRPGINAQLFLLNRNRTAEPRLAIDYSPGNRHTLAFACGLHSRLERLTTYFIEVDGEFSNKNLDFIGTRQFLLSYRWQISAERSLKIEPYFHSLYRIPMVPGTPYSTLNGLSFLVNVPLSNEGKGINKGIDLTFERSPQGGSYYLLTGSVFDSKYRDGEGRRFNTRYNYRYLFNVLGGKEWTSGSRYVFGSDIKFMFRGGERYTPVNEEATLRNGKLVTDEDKMYGNRLSPGLRIDLTLTCKLHGKSASHELAFKILNLTGMKEYDRHRYEPETRTIKKDEVKIIIPNLSYKISF
ncbi:MAG: carboxypeptidase regulatory-like domain-containing protein [Tannerella sp.]|jgi:hypothetical protein|nr:carboxypeptidase regulatory-like domain-containing protein [Tannerella sp.]